MYYVLSSVGVADVIQLSFPALARFDEEDTIVSKLAWGRSALPIATNRTIAAQIECGGGRGYADGRRTIPRVLRLRKGGENRAGGRTGLTASDSTSKGSLVIESLSFAR